MFNFFLRNWWKIIHIFVLCLSVCLWTKVHILVKKFVLVKNWLNNYRIGSVSVTSVARFITFFKKNKLVVNNLNFQSKKIFLLKLLQIFYSTKKYDYKSGIKTSQILDLENNLINRKINKWNFWNLFKNFAQNNYLIL